MKIDHHHLASVASTNTWAKASAHTFDPKSLTVVTTDNQTAGQGRHGRRWTSLPGKSLVASFCFFLSSERKDLGNIAQVVGVALAEAILSFQLAPRLKWPNDILLESKKIGGILCETEPRGIKTLVIVGVGLNVNIDKQDLEELAEKATSMQEVLGHSVEMDALLELVIDHIHRAVELFCKKGFTPFLERYRTHLVHKLGDCIRFHHGPDWIQGTFYSIGDQGELNLIIDEKPTPFHSGEIV